MMDAATAQAFHRAGDMLDPEEWHPENRPEPLPHQIPPTGDWDLWVILAGRGSGKSEGGSRYFARYMRQNPGTRGRIIAPTFGDAVESCIDGPSGLKAIDPEVRWHPSAPGGAKVSWANGSEAVVLGTPTPKDVDRLRALGNRELDWWEEMAANPQLDKAWTQADLGLRIGRPHSIATTTPRPRQKLRELLEAPGTRVSVATIDDNPHLPEDWKRKLKDRYEGTRLGRQELYAELLEDVEGALWSVDLIERNRWREQVPHLRRVVVGVDPPGGSTEAGIVAAGVCDRCPCGGERMPHAFVLSDVSGAGSPNVWGGRAVALYRDLEADRLVAEVNYGGDMVRHVIDGIDPAVSFKLVRATRGKQQRAEPVVSLFEQGRVHMAGTFAQLEAQMTTWVPGESSESPDRTDALVWALTELMIEGARSPARVGSTARRRIPGVRAR